MSTYGRFWRLRAAVPRRFFWCRRPVSEPFSVAQVERAAILQELIDLYELTANSAVDADEGGGGGEGGDGGGGGGGPQADGPSRQQSPVAECDREAIDEERFQRRQEAGLDYFKLDTTQVQMTHCGPFSCARVDFISRRWPCRSSVFPTASKLRGIYL